MAQTIRHKRSVSDDGTITVAGRTITKPKYPTAAQLDFGEIAVNYDVDHGCLFIEKSDGTVVRIGNFDDSDAYFQGGVAFAGDVHMAGPTSLQFSTGGDLTQSIASLPGQFDWQSATANPTTRSDGTTLVEGDQYYHTTDDALFQWNGTAWVTASGQFDWQTGAANPTTTTRSDGKALVDGDMYWQSTTDMLWLWTGAAWKVGTISGTDTQPAAAAPTTRSNGTALISGDFWYDTTNNQLMRWDAAAGPAAWIRAYNIITISDTEPTGPADGDSWYDTNATRIVGLYIWSGDAGAWIMS